MPPLIDLSTVPEHPITRVDVAALINQLELNRRAIADKYPWYYPEGAKGLQIDPFIYTGEFLPIGAGLTTQIQVQIGGDAAFLLKTTKAIVTDDADTTFLPLAPLLVKIEDSGSGRSLSSSAVPIDNWFGTAQLPDNWEMVKVFAPNSSITVTLQNLGAAELHVRLAFCGWKIFQYTPTGQ